MESISSNSHYSFSVEVGHSGIRETKSNWMYTAMYNQHYQRYKRQERCLSLRSVIAFDSQNLPFKKGFKNKLLVKKIRLRRRHSTLVKKRKQTHSTTYRKTLVEVEQIRQIFSIKNFFKKIIMNSWSEEVCLRLHFKLVEHSKNTLIS